MTDWKVHDTEKGGRCMVAFQGTNVFAISKRYADLVVDALNFQAEMSRHLLDRRTHTRRHAAPMPDGKAVRSRAGGDRRKS